MPNSQSMPSLQGNPVGSSHASLGSQGYGGPALRRKLYDKNVADWTARVKKNKQSLEVLNKDCDLLRTEVAKSQAEADGLVLEFRQIDDEHVNEAYPRLEEAKTNFDMMSKQKQMLAVELAENRKIKGQLSRERKLMQTDFERKHGELLKTAETRDKLDIQLAHLNQHVAHLSGDRRRMERELDAVQNDLKVHTEMADEMHSEIEHVYDGIKDGLDVHVGSTHTRDESMSPAARPPYPDSG